MTIWTKRSQHTALSDAAGVGGLPWSGPVRAPGTLPVLGRWARRHAFLITVVMPTVLSALYLWLIAAPIFVSEAKFLVRGRHTPSGGISEALNQAGFRSVPEDAMGLRDYMLSHDAVSGLRQKLDLVGIFRRPEADLFSGLWSATPSAERLLDYYQRMVTAEYDTSSGISRVQVRAFRPEDARTIALELMTAAEGVVNQLNRRVQDDALKVAREEVARAEARVAAAQTALATFRERERALDPSRAANNAVDTVGRLEATLASARAELSEAAVATRNDTPRVVQLRNRVAALEQQVAEERQRSASAATGLTQQISEFERLVTERDLARTQLTSATNSLENARVEAQRQQVYLLRVVEPNLPEYARFPRPLRSVAYLFICLCVLYGLAWLTIAGMREHAS